MAGLSENAGKLSWSGEGGILRGCWWDDVWILNTNPILKAQFTKTGIAISITASHVEAINYIKANTFKYLPTPCSLYLVTCNQSSTLSGLIQHPGAGRAANPANR